MTPTGKVFKVPTGTKLVVQPSGRPTVSNILHGGSTVLPMYGNVKRPAPNWENLVNSKPKLEF